MCRAQGNIVAVNKTKNPCPLGDKALAFRIPAGNATILFKVQEKTAPMFNQGSDLV